MDGWEGTRTPDSGFRTLVTLFRAAGALLVAAAAVWVAGESNDPGSRAFNLPAEHVAAGAANGLQTIGLASYGMQSVGMTGGITGASVHGKSVPGPGPAGGGGLYDDSVPDPPGIDQLTGIRESFTYEVRYGFMRLGDITVTSLRDTTLNGRNAYTFTNIIESNQSIPLVGYRENHYHSIFTHNDSIPYGLRFWVDKLHDEMDEAYRFDFDYDRGQVVSFEEQEPVDTLDLDHRADSGPVLFYLGRLFAGTDADIHYPIYIEHGERGGVDLTFSPEVHSYSSEAFPDQELETFKVSGNADFEGPFGFTGEFEGRFKADEYRIPLEARVSVWVGNVRIRLVDYERH